jgi:hypothetical protein
MALSPWQVSDGSSFDDWQEQGCLRSSLILSEGISMEEARVGSEFSRLREEGECWKEEDYV